MVTGLENGATITGDIDLSCAAVIGSPKIQHYEFFLDGVFFSKVLDPKAIRVATDALTDGFHETENRCGCRHANRESNQ